MTKAPDNRHLTQIPWWREPIIHRRAEQWEKTHYHHKAHWWQQAVIYQIFPLSFCDSNGDGTGDLNGVIDKLDYIRALGVDAIWLNPIYPSKHIDAGYAVTDFDDIDPLFGNLDTFQRLVDLSHCYGIKLIIDQVWNHTADTHPWFLESASGRHNPYSDWYTWADAKDNGDPPNNWLSAFTGKSAWCWHEGRQQYYLANFMPSQPELNWLNDKVIDTLMDSARRWLDRGVDGFRIDAVNFFANDPELHDNPARTPVDGLPDGIDPANPLTQQKLVNSFCRPETLKKLKKIRHLMDEYPGTVSLGELALAEDSIVLSGKYVAGNNRLHLAYNSALLRNEPLSAGMLYDVLRKTHTHFPNGGQCWIVGNHDYQRLRSRWTGADADGNPYPTAFYRMIAGLLIALPGAFCLYQGDELGLPLTRIPEEISELELRDPYGKSEFPRIVGRDGSRTPMPWCADRKNLGFTESDTPWLPVPARHRDYAVDRLAKDPSSLLSTWRRLLQWRLTQPALTAGDYAMLAAHESVFAVRRSYAAQSLYCLFNISPTPQTYTLNPAPGNPRAETQPLFCINGDDRPVVNHGGIELGPYQAVFICARDSSET